MLMLDVISFFSGIGILDLGFEHAGFNIKMVNEIHKPFLNAYKYSRSKMRINEPEFGYQNRNINDYLNGGKNS